MSRLIRRKPARTLNSAPGYSGTDALHLARKILTNVMILDIGMPDMTAYEVARRVRTERWGNDVFLVAVTGWGQAEDRVRALAAGFDHHLTKPVDPSELQALLNGLVGKRRGAQG
jgi:DNA-binding response OmpR family regulator